MAISKEKKAEIVSELTDLFGSSKLSVFASYEGLTVAQAQELRKSAAESGTTIKVVKNRLVKVAMDTNQNLKDSDKSMLKGQLLYAFNSEDEIAPAKNLAEFAKQNEALQIVGGYDEQGNLLDNQQVMHLATLPGKDELRATLVGTIHAPVSGFVRVIAGNINGLLNVLNARANQ